MSSSTEEAYDYVVVGSGAAGAIVAARLAADAGISVCVLEAGPPDTHPYLHLPAGFIKVIFNPRLAWQFGSVPTARTGGRRIPLPQGKTYGGSTSINGLVYNRGQREDFDGWAAQGNPGWSHAEVLPYFRKTETYLGGGDPALRGSAGPLPVSGIDWIHPICEAFLDGAAELGMPRNPDYNGAAQQGVGYFQRTIANGRRMSTAKTFLRPAMRRPNLRVIAHAQATRIVCEGRRAVGVEFARGPGAPGQQVRARREVLVCAGAINTPKLLMLSGLGDGGRLQQLGIEVVQHLPGVGARLKDHFSIRLVARVRDALTINELARAPRLWGQAWNWLRGRPSILALSPSLASRSPFDDPIVQPNYLDDEDDRHTLVRGVRLARQLLHTQALARWREAEAMPGPQVQSDDEILDFISRYGVSSYHLNGSARMGPAGDAAAVVDARLRVHGMAGLRVIDASVMPEITSANTCAATMMIGEKGADMVRADRG